VQRDGIVQAVDVPPGQGTVTWHYTTPEFTTGFGISLTATMVTLLLAVVGVRQRPTVSITSRRQLESQAA
jgi:hypothetical protein